MKAKKREFASSGFSAKETFISAFVVSLHGRNEMARQCWKRGGGGGKEKRLGPRWQTGTVVVLGPGSVAAEP